MKLFCKENPDYTLTLKRAEDSIKILYKHYYKSSRNKYYKDLYEAKCPQNPASILRRKKYDKSCAKVMKNKHSIVKKKHIHHKKPLARNIGADTYRDPDPI